MKGKKKRVVQAIQRLGRGSGVRVGSCMAQEGRNSQTPPTGMRKRESWRRSWNILYQPDLTRREKGRADQRPARWATVKNMALGNKTTPSPPPWLPQPSTEEDLLKNLSQLP